MSQQNILNFYGQKKDFKVDTYTIFSKEYENSIKYDLKLDYSEFYDFQLDYSPDYQFVTIDTPVLTNPTFNDHLSIDDYYITDMNGVILMTQNYNEIQFNL